ncbi:hypothetical protein GCM10010219_16620 [Streptomyces netropsis]|nr:hypothetical protein GCM10010219_16620 [Streptomyces netropsis]
MRAVVGVLAFRQASIQTCRGWPEPSYAYGVQATGGGHGFCVCAPGLLGKQQGHADSGTPVALSAGAAAPVRARTARPLSVSRPPHPALDRLTPAHWWTGRDKGGAAWH